MMGTTLWVSDPENIKRVESISVKEALICLKTYQDWWNGLKNGVGV